MKKTFAVLFSLVVIFSLVGTAFAMSGPPGTGWYTGITLQNVGTDAATVDITAYASDGTTATASSPIALGGSVNLLPTNFTGMGAGFQGGAIVSSSQELRSIVNVTNRPVTSLGQSLGDTLTPHSAAAQYQGMSAPATTLNFPLVKNNNYSKSTTLYVQNAGSAAATATASFIFAGTTYTYTTPSLQPGQTAVFSADMARNNGNPPTSGNVPAAIGAATVTSAQPLAGVFLEHKTTETHATLLQSTRAFTAADADTVLYSPTNKDKFVNRFTGLQVQNVGPGSVDLKVTYTTTGDNPCTAKNTTASVTITGLAEGASNTFPSSEIPGDNCLASAKVEVTSGSGKIVGTVGESYVAAYLTANPTKYQESTISFAFPAKFAATKVSLPVYKEDSFNKGTGVNVQNTGGGDAEIVFTVTSSKGTFVTNKVIIPVGTSKSFVDLRKTATITWNGTAMTAAALGCTDLVNKNVCGAGGNMSMIITSDQPIVVIANESTYPFTNPRIQQDKNNYEGFNLVP